MKHRFANFHWSSDGEPPVALPRRPRLPDCVSDQMLPMTLGLQPGEDRVSLAEAFGLVWDLASALAFADERFDRLVAAVESVAYALAAEDLG